MKWYLEYRRNPDHAGKPVKVLSKKGIKSVIITKEFDPVEPSTFGQSLWQNIRCVDAYSGRGQRSSVFEMPSHR
jgi:hypothetical protein